MTTSQKVDPSNGQPIEIKSLTVVNIESMVKDAVFTDGINTQFEIQPGQRIVIPNHEQTKCSFKRNGIVRAYAANTNQGLVRNYNEDRVSIILNIVKPE